MMQLIILTFLIASSKGFITKTGLSTDGIMNCGEEMIKSCETISVDFASFKNGDDINMFNTVLSKTDRVEGDIAGSYGFSYESSDGSANAFLVYSDTHGSKSLNGHIEISAEEYYVVESCGKDCYILILEDSKKLEFHEIDYDFKKLLTDEELKPHVRSQIAEGRNSNAETTVHAIFYYTKKLKAITPNIASFINTEVTKLNAGYKNSRIPLKVAVHCIQEIDLDEPADSQRRIDLFKAKKGSVKNLLGSADIAVLMTGTTVTIGAGEICGQVDDLNIPRSNGAPVTWVAKNCGLTLSHEVSHLFGGRHNREQDNQDQYVNYAHGFLIKGTKYHTIMAYETFDQPMTANYYSNTEQKFQGKPMGDSRNNVVRIIRESRVAMSKIGDESMKCGAPAPAPAPAPEKPDDNGPENPDDDDGPEFPDDDGPEFPDDDGPDDSGEDCKNEESEEYCEDTVRYGLCDSYIDETTSEMDLCQKSCNACSMENFK